MGWTPRLSTKQKEHYLCNKRYQLATGPRFTGKTWAFEHAVLRHCWRNKGRFAIVTKTTRSGEDGIWKELTSLIYDEWVENGIASDVAEFGWIRPPYVNAVTKVHTAILRNRFGTESEIKLFPVERPEDAADKFFSTQFSGIWISEGHIYNADTLMKVAVGQLRLPTVTYDEHRLFIDTNPPKEGKKHWLFEEFFKKRALKESEFPPEWDDDTRLSILEFQQNSAVFEYTQEDNPYADPRKLREFRALYVNNKDDYDRFVRGLWTDASTNLGVFKQVFDRNIHVVGSASSPDDSEWEVIYPTNGPDAQRDGGKILLVGGWDPGEVNHAWAGLQPYVGKKGLLCFDVLDEFFVKRGLSVMPIEALTREVLGRRKTLERMSEVPIAWRDYSDSSAMKARTHATKADWQAMPGQDSVMDAAIVAGVSGGEIQLIGSDAVKNKGWQQRRVNFLSQLLAEGRIRVSANCKMAIQMFENLRLDASPKAKTYLDPVQEEKHIFDAISYPICMMLLDELTLPVRSEGKSRSAMRSV